MKLHSLIIQTVHIAPWENGRESSLASILPVRDVKSLYYQARNYTKYPVQCTLFSEQDDGKLGE